MSENKLDLCHVCCCCWEKFGVNSKSLRNVNSTVEDLMKLYIFPGFSTDIEDYPTTICSNCHRNLFLLKSGKSSRNAWGEKVSKIDWTQKTRRMPVLKRKSTDEIPSESLNPLCPSCFTRKGAGIQHKCGKEVAGCNLLFLALALGSLQAEKVAAGILRNKMETEGLADGSEFYISTGGNPLHVKVGTPDNKTARRTVNQISVQIIKQLQIVLELSLNRTKQMMAVLRKGMGNATAIESNIFGKLQQIEDTISGFYQVQKVQFKSSADSILSRDLVFVQDTSSFIMHLISERHLDPFHTLVRISIDAGGSFLKVIVNVFEPNSESGKFLNSGVQRCQILAITEDVPESNFNLRTILDNLNLQDVVFSLAFDLKCANAIFGLSSHAGKRACLWCEGLATSEPGELRSLESLDYWYNEYSKSGHDKTKMKDCMNVINPRILYKDEDPKSLLQDLVPPPELHLLIGFVSLLGVSLMDLWPGFDDWLKSKNILQRGYQGRGWDGNNCNTILKHLDTLEEEVRKTVPHLIQFIECLKHFREIKSACFGNTLEPGIKKMFVNLKNSFLSLQELCENKGKKLSLTWKVHILLCHVEPFVLSHQCGLGRYAEQVGESIHAKFKPTWSRYNRSEGHTEHGDKLLSAVKQFGGRRIN